MWGVMDWKNERRLKVKKAPCVQTWKQACPICLRQGLRQWWKAARGRSLGDWSRVTPVGEQKTRNPLTEVNAACPAVDQGGRGGGGRGGDEKAQFQTAKTSGTRLPLVFLSKG